MSVRGGDKLAQARRPAVIRTQAEVRTFWPRPGGGYEVTYVVHDAERRRGVPLDSSAAGSC